MTGTPNLTGTDPKVFSTASTLQASPGEDPAPPDNCTAGKIRIDNTRFAAFRKKLMGNNPRWILINKSLQVAFLPVSTFLYFMGSDELSIRAIVYYIWRVGVFGMTTNNIPYECYNFLGMPSLCLRKFLNLDDHLNFSVDGFLGYVVGGAISLRIIAFCLERLVEAFLRTNIFSGIIDRVFPEPQAPHYNQYIAEVYMGDVFRDISNSTIVSRAKVEKAFNRLQDINQGDGAKLLVEIGKHVSDANNAAAGAVYSQMADELSKSAHDKSIIKSCWDGLVAILPPLASLSAKVIKAFAL